MNGGNHARIVRFATYCQKPLESEWTGRHFSCAVLLSGQLVRLKDSISATARAVRRSILDAESAHVQLDMLERLRVHLVGIFYAEVGPEWSSGGKQETDYLHHIDLSLPVVEREEMRAKTELGAAQKDTARELSAKLASLKHSG